MKNAAQLGAAGLAAGVVLNATAAQAAVPAGAVASGAGEVAAAHEPFVVHVQDAAAGALDFYHGERHYQVTDRELAAAILRHAR
ncbi:hypothetical protein POF50_034720 [Streptomyces sp. SL13]|uniref:Uncharacterized protein n=1 Tax=Streptantibioticus silvisoli TaxID=2705255 RepID=A0AA90KKC2_9ACTN|nr:hypothetical protein [Streptantibioticus silvisoli]MDI5967588.1 hypothetical protein [Streptantibioticus silvisoli]MDI5974444.1 hypothetical protein [Streptantibioticus silvisoli]